jgi:hypothetical protein
MEGSVGHQLDHASTAWRGQLVHHVQDAAGGDHLSVTGLESEPELAATVPCTSRTLPWSPSGTACSTPNDATRTILTSQ